jgi:hypothetical protein
MVAYKYDLSATRRDIRKIKEIKRRVKRPKNIEIYTLDQRAVGTKVPIPGFYAKTRKLEQTQLHEVFLKLLIISILLAKFSRGYMMI